MSGDIILWIKVHPALADRAFGEPVHSRLVAIRDGLVRHGYSLKLDIGKRSTRAVVSRTGFRSRSTYPGLEGFLRFEEARLAQMDCAATPAPTQDREG